MQIVVGVGAGVLGGVTIYPHTIGLNSYRKIVAQYMNNEEQPLDDETKKLAEEVGINFSLLHEKWQF